LHPDADGRRLITLQLGNGCSITASRGGVPLETSMGFTPLAGLIMGTRSGDLDPSLPLFIAEHEKLSPAEVESLLNRESGLLGLSGSSSDMRDLEQAAKDGDKGAQLAIDAFCHRVRKYLGAYLAVLGGCDAVVFGGGIGQNSAVVRACICEGMGWAGIELDEGRNATRSLTEARISSDASHVEVWVANVDEASIIAHDVAQCLAV
jgi:acetate kinase